MSAKASSASLKGSCNSQKHASITSKLNLPRLAEAIPISVIIKLSSEALENSNNNLLPFSPSMLANFGKSHTLKTKMRKENCFYMPMKSWTV